MKNLLIGLTILSSMSSFGASYEGHGVTDEVGTEVCAMDVERIEDGSLTLGLRGLGLYIETKVDSATTTFDVTSKSIEIPVSDVRVTGKLKNGKPVSFKIESSEEYVNEEGSVQELKESMNCNF